jgi:DNA polymerase III subunit epsilon
MHDPRVIVFDVETTGTDKRNDQVIELCIQFGLEDGAASPGASSVTWRIRPSVPIHPGAQAVHGITMEDLASCPTFGEVAAEIREVIAAARVLIGYNLTFDIEMLQAEYERIGQPPLDLLGKEIVDPFRLWQQCEPRSLQDAHRRFVGQEFEAAHSATADVAATGRVLRGMLEHFGLAGDWSEIARVCEPQRDAWVGPSRHLRWDDEGRLVIGFGKHSGRPLSEVARGPDAGYLLWIAEKDFPFHVREICTRALQLAGAELEVWARRTYGCGPGEAAAVVEDVREVDIDAGVELYAGGEVDGAEEAEADARSDAPERRDLPMGQLVLFELAALG